MPAAAGFFKGKGGAWKGLSSTVLSLVRIVLPYGKGSNASKNSETSWQSMNAGANGRNRYVDIEMNGRSAHKLTDGNRY